jgi:DNA modification methylase
MPERNFENRTLYHGDNLDFLKGINSGTVNLIATDPPFNKNKDFHATPDSLASGASFTDRWRWDEDVHQEWIDEIKDDYPGVWQAIENGRINHSPSMAAFLCWLGVRLIQMHRVLADDGSIYLHIDHTAHAYVKCLMDALFGQRQFRNEIVWDYSFRLMDLPHFFNRKHDLILFYAKSKSAKFSMPKTVWTREEIIKTRKQKVHIDNDGNELIWMPGGRGHSKSRLKKISEIIDDGKAVSDVWAMPIISSSSKERTGWPTQKPLALYERIIAASSNPGDIVLDPFAGCATTPIAAERLGRQWIGMDIWDGAYNVVKERLESIGLTSDSANDNRLVTLGDMIYTTTPPIRTDETDDDPDVPDLVLRPIRVKAKWELLNHAEMRDILAEAQSNGDTIICAGCGIALPVRYMQLDHNMPRKDGGENVITNRILLCGPCNLSKSARLTLSGLRDSNRKEGFTTNRDMAELASSKARDAAERSRIEIV